jgi:transcriptional regulator with XRE-family HTH domain
MTELANWLKDQMQSRGLSQAQLAVYAGLAQATISDILSKGHIPRVETLFRLADYLDIDRVEMLHISGHVKRADQLPGAEAAGRDDDHLTWQLIQEFRRVPDEWKGEAIQQVAMFTRLAKLPPTGFQPAHIIGDEDEENESDQTPAGQPTTQAA